jgi:hypothetical protein
MRLRATLALAPALALAIGACIPGEPSDSTGAEVPASTISRETITSSPAETTVTAPASTTSIPATTTTAGTTTTTALRTTDPNLPSAMGRHEVPWAQVGAGWYVVLYDPSKAFPADASDIREGPVVLYLVDADGNRYEMTAWAPGMGPYHLLDATASSALTVRAGGSPDDSVFERIDMTTGARTVVHTRGFPESTYGENPTVSLTRPSGANAVVYRSDGADEWLERRSPDGSLIATVFTQPYTEASQSLAWMYGYGGTSLLVTHHGGISEISNTGALLNDLWVPMDTRCEPQRWWDADTFVAACYGRGPATAPDDGYGNPHIHYGRVWLLKTDGTAGVPVTSLPPAADVVDFGYHDMWPVGVDALLKWTGDCGSAHTARLQPDGTGVALTIAVPPSLLLHGAEMIDFVGGRITHHGWETCDSWVGALFSTDVTGGDSVMLVPKIGDGRSVIGVVGLATVYP